VSVESNGGKITLIVASDGADKPLAPGESVQHGPGRQVRRRLDAKREVDIDTLQSQLTGMQRQIDLLLSQLSDPADRKYRLTDIEFGLAITAEGSIGIATLGGEVSLTLTYSRG
jgi:hypothetical protein